jgi:Flp pilus assembly protein TadG
MPRRPLSALGADRRAVSAVEFALVLPFLVTLYLGTYQVSDAVACSRKVTVTARAVTDLTTQYQSVNASTVNTILNASQQIFYPFNAANSTITVSEIYTDNQGATTVVWSQTLRGTARVAGSSFAAPASVVTKGGYLIVSEVAYAYTPAISFGVIGPLALGDTIYMSPRLSLSEPMT